jgi:hypothetical protein
MDLCKKYVRIGCEKGQLKFQNNGVFKMICITAILPCAFVSDHTL